VFPAFLQIPDCLEILEILEYPVSLVSLEYPVFLVFLEYLGFLWVL
jgi:hypothetical protein